MKVTLKHTLSGHEAAIYKLIPGKRAGTFLSCGGEGYVVEWEPHLTERGQLVARDTDSLYCMKLISEEHLLLGTKNGVLIQCSLNDFPKVRKLDIHKKGIYSIEANEDLIFTAGGDGWLRVLSRETMNLIFSTQLSGKALRSLILIPGTNNLIVAGSESKIFLLNAQSFDVISYNDSAHEHSVFCVHVKSADQFYSAGRDARLNCNCFEKRIETIISVPAHMNTINDIALNRDASLLATGSRDRTIKIWDKENLELMKVIDGHKFRSHTHSINSIMWLDNKTLISAGDDRLIKVWIIEV